MTLTIGHETTLAELGTAYRAGDTATLRRYCEWNDANGDWQKDDEGDDCPVCGDNPYDFCRTCGGAGAVNTLADWDIELYWAVIQGWFAEDRSTSMAK